MVAVVGEPTDLVDLAARPGTLSCRVTQSAAQTGWTTGAFTNITFGAEDYDWGNLFAVGTSATKLMLGQAALGLWLIGGHFVPAGNAGATLLRARYTFNGTAVNGATPSFGNSVSSILGLAMTPTPVITTASTDSVELQGLVTAASGTLGTAVSGDSRSSFWAIFMGVQ
jgi:hypothetical protein